MFEIPAIDDIVTRALAEDLGVEPHALGVADASLLDRDVTSRAVIGEDASFTGVVVAREECIVCGLPVAARVFSLVSESAGLFQPVDFFPLVAEGARVAPGTAVAEVEGVARAILAGERTALDFLMVLSGIATETAAWVAAADGAFLVCDTRKTVPGLRLLSKYAVRVGGGSNHRSGLHDMVLIKDNHVRHAGGVGQAVRSARAKMAGYEIEAEADTAAQAVEAVAAGADRVLLDNLDDAGLAEAVKASRAASTERGKQVLLEVSGGITRQRLEKLRDVGVDLVSSSALTLAGPVDFALDQTAGFMS